MKKLFLFSLASLCCIVSKAQKLTSDNLKICEPEMGEAVITEPVVHVSKSKFLVTPIWSEDFASGIPSTWTNAGYNGNGSNMLNAIWEYRGPNTTPNNTIGSRGAYNGTSGPLLSPTASNGFIIFDSDYLDNNGIPGSFGTGVAPTPHIGTLKTSSLNLSGHPLINLSFHSTMRKFAGRALIAFSSNGGLTFPDTVEIHSYLPINGTSSNPEMVTIDVSNYIGGSSNAVLSFIFDGATSNPGASGLGYYRWMIDDIQILPKEKNQLSFHDLPRSVKYSAISNSNIETPLLGHNKLAHADPVAFSTAIYNSGVNTQTNVYLKVEVLDGANNLLTTLSSALIPSVLSGDTIHPSQLLTNSYTFPFTGEFKLSFYIQSDSINKIQSYQNSKLDTLIFNMNDSIQSLDFTRISNSLGTSQIGYDGSAIAVKIKLNAPDTIKGVWVGLSTSTIAGGDLLIELYDTNGFDYYAGFGGSALFSQASQINAADVGGNGKYISLNTPYSLSSGAYYIVVYMYSNAGVNPVSIYNDATITQYATSALMYHSDDARWYSGYSNTNALNSPFIRTVFSNPALSASFNISGVLCKGDSTGSITLVPSMNNTSILWSTGDTTATITNLVAGNYSVTLSNGTYSRVYNNINITEPVQALNTAVNAVNESCQGFNDGIADVIVQGGTSPYSYVWSNGDTTSAIRNLAPGNYYVTVTDANACSRTDSVTINPSFSIIPKPNLSYRDTVTICEGSPLVLTVDSVYDHYLWSNGDTNASITPVLSGTYFLKASSSFGCVRYSDTLYLQIVAPINPEVKLVTYDTLSGSNLVFFTKPAVDYLTNYHLFKNSQLYMTVGTSNPGLIEDQTPFAANIYTSSDYNLSSTDSCGAIGIQGSDHTSIALNVTKDSIYQKAKLSWNIYSGNSVSYQRIYKRINGTMTVFDSVHNRVTSFIDMNSTDSEDYLIEAVFTQPTGLSTPFEGSISNLHSYNPVTLNEYSFLDFRIYPNPATDAVTVKIPDYDNRTYAYTISDIRGKLIVEGEFNSEMNSINLETLPKGFYFLNIGKSEKSFKLLKN